jgi:Family of unknown function (DUF5317)
MFILYAIPAGILAGFALGGRLQGLSTLRFKWAWVFMLGLAVQLVLFSDFVTERIGGAGMPIYVLSTLAVAAAVAANLRIRGIPIVLLGAVSNFAAIVANGGYMPASPEAMAALGKPAKAGYSNSSFLPDPALPWLTDIFALPSWLPYTNVFSIGDVLIGLGVVVVIASAMRTPVAPTVRDESPTGSAAAPTAPNAPAVDPAAPNSASA